MKNHLSTWNGTHFAVVGAVGFGNGHRRKSQLIQIRNHRIALDFGHDTGKIHTSSIIMPQTMYNHKTYKFEQFDFKIEQFDIFFVTGRCLWCKKYASL